MSLFETAMDLTRLSIEMKREGIPIDEKKREFHRERLDTAREKAKEEFLDIVQDDFDSEALNLDSSQQIRSLFYDRLGLVPRRAYNSKTTGIPGVPKTALRDAIIEGTGDLKKAATALLKYREENKYETTYVGKGYYLEKDHYGLKVFRRDKRVHFNWSPVTAETFRSTGDGQQVPKHVYNAQGIITRPGLRDLYISPPGMTMIEADYSQQELRKVALYSGCRPLIHELTRPGGDAHALFTRAMFKIPEDKWDKKMHKGQRDLGKTLVFAVLIYGGKPETGWRQVAPKYPALTVRFVEEAKKFVYDAMPEIPRYHSDQISFAKLRGYTPIPNEEYTLKWKYGPIGNNLVGEPENSEIINKRIQTSCAIMMNRAMVRVQRALWALDNRIKIVLQVHDALFVFAPCDLAEKAAKIIKEQMEISEKWLLDEMEYPVDIKMGNCWGELVDYKIP